MSLPTTLALQPVQFIHFQGGLQRILRTQEPQRTILLRQYIDSRTNRPDQCLFEALNNILKTDRRR